MPSCPMSGVDLPTVGSVGSVGSINGWWNQPTAENPSNTGFLQPYTWPALLSHFYHHLHQYSVHSNRINCVHSHHPITSRVFLWTIPLYIIPTLWHILLAVLPKSHVTSWSVTPVVGSVGSIGSIRVTAAVIPTPYTARGSRSSEMRVYCTISWRQRHVHPT